jgi:hypothetical protein
VFPRSLHAHARQQACPQPRNGARLQTGQPISIVAQAKDADGKIVSVQFGIVELGTEGESPLSHLGEARQRPYGISWTPATAGHYRITATAYDDGGAETTAAVTVIVSTR